MNHKWWIRIILLKKIVHNIIISKQTMSCLISHNTAIQKTPWWWGCAQRGSFSHIAFKFTLLVLWHFQFECKKQTNRKTLKTMISIWVVTRSVFLFSTYQAKPKHRTVYWTKRLILSSSETFPFLNPLRDINRRKEERYRWESNRRSIIRTDER